MFTCQSLIGRVATDKSEKWRIVDVHVSIPYRKGRNEGGASVMKMNTNEVSIPYRKGRNADKDPIHSKSLTKVSIPYRKGRNGKMEVINTK